MLVVSIIWNTFYYFFATFIDFRDTKNLFGSLFITILDKQNINYNAASNIIVAPFKLIN